MSKFNFIMTVISLSLSISAFASSQTETCERLSYDAETQCVKMICESNSSRSRDCTRDGDFQVMLQECHDEVFKTLIRQYNEQNPQGQLNCL